MRPSDGIAAPSSAHARSAYWSSGGSRLGALGGVSRTIGTASSARSFANSARSTQSRPSSSRNPRMPWVWD